MSGGMDEKSGLVSSTSSTAGSPPTHDSVIYHSMPPSKKMSLQLFFVLVAFAVLGSLVVCFVLGSDSKALYLLGVNQVITFVNCLVLLKWYINGTLPQEWLWYLVTVAAFLIFQSVVTDIMVGEYPYSTATVPPITTVPVTSPGNGTNTTSPTATAPSNTTTHPNVSFPLY